MHIICPLSFPIVCIIIPLTPRSTEQAFILQTVSPSFPVPTPTPLSSPFTANAAIHCQPLSSRRSPSYESSILLQDLAPPLQFELSPFNFNSPHPPSMSPSADPRQSPAFPFSPHPSSPIPLITSPLPHSPTANSPTPTASSDPAFFSASSVTPNPSQAESLSQETSDISFHITTTSENATAPTNLPLTPSSVGPHQSEYIIMPVSHIHSSPSGSTSPCVTASASKESLVTQLAFGSRPVSPLSLSTLPPLSPSGSRCHSPGPSSPPLRSLSPCPACHCTCAPCVPPPPSQTRNDPSTMEILI